VINIFAFALAIFIFAAPALADNTEQCLQLYYTKAFAKALSFCRLSATKGNSQSQYVLGLMYSDGLGVKKNKPEAIKWLRAAAGQAYAAAHYKLTKLENEPDSSNAALNRFMGKSRRDGASMNAPKQEQKPDPVNQPAIAAPVISPATKPVHHITPPDDNALYRQYLTAAQQGNADARFMLGLFYLEGRGVQQNTARATSQFKLAAKQGHAHAQFSLGLMYDEGRGDIIKNEKMAEHWLSKAAMQGLADAQYSLGLIASANKQDEKAVKWWLKAAAQKHAKAQHNLAISYLTGKGVQANRDKAAQWFIKEAEHGDPQTQFNLGRLYSEGEWLQQSGSDAANWFYRAGEIWVSMNQPDKARQSANKIKQLASAQHLTAPNLFLADVLTRQIEEAGAQ